MSDHLLSFVVCLCCGIGLGYVTGVMRERFRHSHKWQLFAKTYVHGIDERTTYVLSCSCGSYKKIRSAGKDLPIPDEARDRGSRVLANLLGDRS